MTVQQMNNKIISVYPNDTWKNKVNRMYDDQVIAVYYKFLKSGKFEKPTEKNGKQLNFFKFL